MFAQALRLFSLGILSLSANAASYPEFGTLQTSNSSGVMNVVINNTFSSTNLFDVHIMSDLANLIETLQANDTDIKVVVFSSANPEFFISHLDLNYLLPGFGVCLPSARGVGNELLMSCDMRFAAASPSVLLSQLETSFGLTTGAGGAMYLAHEIGRGRAFEYVFSSSNVDAKTAARIGWINRAFDASAELHSYVSQLAARIALFPLQGIAAVKLGINTASRPARDVLIEYAQKALLELGATPVAQAFEETFLRATDSQSDGTTERNYGNGDVLVEFF